MTDFAAVANALMTLKQELEAAPKMKSGFVHENRINKMRIRAADALQAAGDADMQQIYDICIPYQAGMRG